MAAATDVRALTPETWPALADLFGHTRNLFPGVASVFARHGFAVVTRRKADRPVMRKDLS